MTKTLKEVADELGISKQRVYRYYIKNCITDVHHDAHQTTSPIQLDDVVVSQLYQHFSEKTTSPELHQTTSHDAVSDVVGDAVDAVSDVVGDAVDAVSDVVGDAVYEHLIKQIEEKDRQLAAKDEMINGLIDKLDQEQQLHAMTNQRLLMLEEGSSGKEKKSWFSRFKKG